MRRRLLVLLVAGAVAIGMVTLTKMSYGSFKPVYYVTVNLPRAGQQLQSGSDVREHGVTIGKVSDIQLVNRHARLTLQIQKQYRVPSDAVAVVTLKTLLGEKYVDLRFPSLAAPYVTNGGTLSRGTVGPELEDVLSDGVSVLQAIRPTDLATVVHELSVAAQGHGQDISNNIQANAALSTIFAKTIPEQLQGLHDFDVVFGALKDKGVDLNLLADAINQGAPVYASATARRNLDRALTAVTPFAKNLGDLLILNRSDWDRMIAGGDTVLGTIAARAGGFRDLIHGLYIYVNKLSPLPALIPDGTGQAGFVNFMGGGGNDNSMQTRAQICAALPAQIAAGAPLCNGGA